MDNSFTSKIHQNLLEILIPVLIKELLWGQVLLVHHAQHHPFLFVPGPLVIQVWVLVLCVPFIKEFIKSLFNHRQIHPQFQIIHGSHVNYYGGSLLRIHPFHFLRQLSGKPWNIIQ